MTNFPNSIDTYVNPQPTDDEVLVPHATQHQNHNDSVIALETKVGANNSTVQTSHDFKLSEVATGDKAVSKTATQTLTNKTLTAPTITGGTSTSQTLTTPTVNVGADATGDIYARSSGGGLTRIPNGSLGQVLTATGAGVVPSFQTPTTATAQQIQDQSFVYAATSTGTDSYAITLTPAPASYVIGQRFVFRADVANTGACSLNVNGLGARTIVKGISTGLSDGDISANQIVDVIYDGTNLVMQSPIQTVQKNGVSGANINIAAGAVYTITHSLGKIPKTIKLNTVAFISGGSGSVGIGECWGFYDANGQSVVAKAVAPAAGQFPYTDTTCVIAYGTSDGIISKGTISNVTSTSFDLTVSSTVSNAVWLFNYLVEA